DVRRKRSASCGSGGKFFADDPGAQFGPIFIRWPAGVFRPFAFYSRIPVAFVFLAELCFLLHEPLRIFCEARFGDERERREFSFCTAVNPEANRNAVGGNSDV